MFDISASVNSTDRPAGGDDVTGQASGGSTSALSSTAAAAAAAGGASEAGKGEDEVEDDYDEYEGGEIQSASLVHEPQRNPVTQQPSSGAVAAHDPVVPGGKAKREPGSSSSSSGTRPSSGASSASTNVDDDDNDDAIQVQFRSLLTYHIGAYITWPKTANPADDDRCSADARTTDSRPRVTGYQLRYRRADERGEFVTRTLGDPMALVDDLVPDTRYRYQVKYLYDDGAGESAWSAEAELDTSAQSLLRSAAGN